MQQRDATFAPQTKSVLRSATTPRSTDTSRANIYSASTKPLALSNHSSVLYNIFLHIATADYLLSLSHSKCFCRCIK